MRKLTVKNFSVIKEAELEFGKITVLIGPQSSGKSILCKLAFFSHDLLSQASDMLDEEETYEKFIQHASEEFAKLFPPQSWGKKHFNIRYTCGEFTIEIGRRHYKRDPNDRADFVFPSWFIALYKRTLQRILFSRRRRKDQMAIFSLHEEFFRRARSRIGPESSWNQLFIPAGRSFFSSVGKALAVFEEGGSIDPLTLRFGRQIDWDYGDYSIFYRTKSIVALSKLLKDESRILLGGEIREERGKTVFVATDGRIIPLPNLSSGQQEILPLLSTLAERITRRGPQTLYIEEPETHLFPAAQASVVSLFSSIAKETRPNISIVLTTHSPYMLSKFNNLILAGQLAKRRTLRAHVEKIVRSPYWVKKGILRAYSIEKGKTTSIIDVSGLINGEYLDSVSETIGNEFDSLLRLEYDHTKAS